MNPSTSSTASAPSDDVVAETEPTVETPAPDTLVEQDLLVEDVSIDGMCGVY